MAAAARATSGAIPPVPLLGEGDCAGVPQATPLRQPGQEALAPARRAAITAAWAVFAVLLLYASGLPPLAAAVLQQLDCLSADGWALAVLFPLDGGGFSRKEDGRLDLVGRGYLSLAVPWFLASAVWEAFLMLVVLPPALRPKRQYRVNDTMSSISTGMLYLLISQVALIQWATPLYEAIYARLRLTDAFLDPQNAWGWWLCFLASDLLYYVYHRTSHYCSWLWASHVVHHSSEEYNLSTALRQPANDVLVPSSLISTTPMALLFPAELAAFHGQLGLLYQFWIHTQLVPPLPAVELVFNTPSLHRIHHARNSRALGKNYGSILSVWDRAGGTLEPESAGSEELFYGVIPPLRSWNPVWANCSHWHHMLWVQRRWHGLRTPFVHWTPPNGRCPSLGSRLNPREPYDLFPESPLLRALAVAEFALVLASVAVLVFWGPPAARLASLAGWGPRAASSACYAAAFALAAAALAVVAQLESARSAAALRRALAAGAALSLAVAALAEAALAEGGVHGGAGLLSAWQLPVAACLLLHAGFLAALWPPKARAAPGSPAAAAAAQ